MGPGRDAASGGFASRAFGLFTFEGEAPMPASTPASAPIIASLKASGLGGVPVCHVLQHSGAVAFDTIGLHDKTPIS